MSPKVYVGFSAGTNKVARITEDFSKGGPSHAFLLYNDPQIGGWLQLGVDGGGWIHMPAELVDGVTAVYELPDVDLWTGVRHTRKWLGSRHDVGPLFELGPIQLWQTWLKMKSNNITVSLTSWLCAGVILKVLQESGVPIELAPCDTEPRLLEADVLSAHSLRHNFTQIISEG